MTHSPPVPDANASPYPLHPEPRRPDDFESNFAFGIEDADTEENGGWGNRALIGIGAGVALGAAAVVGALIFGRPAKARSKPRGKSAASKPAKRAAARRPARKKAAA